MSVTFAHRDECETTGNWTLVRRTLGVRAFGINVVDIPPGGQIPEHDETKRDQEEVFYVLSGKPAPARLSSAGPTCGPCATERSHGGKPTAAAERPSKPWGWRSRRTPV